MFNSRLDSENAKIMVQNDILESLATLLGECIMRKVKVSHFIRSILKGVLYSMLGPNLLGLTVAVGNI